MTMTTTNDDLKSLGLSHLAAKERYGLAMRKYMHMVDPMADEDLFWDLVDQLHTTIKKVLSYGAGRTPQGGCEEFVRSKLFDMSFPHNNGTWDILCRFYKKYEAVKAKYSTLLWSLPGLERGGDGFGDLCDSLPLAGKTILKQVQDGDIANYKHLSKAVYDRFYPQGDLITAPPEEKEKQAKKGTNFILNGENYIGMSICDALTEKFLSLDFMMKARREGE